MKAGNKNTDESEQLNELQSQEILTRLESGVDVSLLCRSKIYIQTDGTDKNQT